MFSQRLTVLLDGVVSIAKIRTAVMANFKIDFGWHTVRLFHVAEKFNIHLKKKTKKKKENLVHLKLWPDSNVVLYTIPNLIAIASTVDPDVDLNQLNSPKQH